MRFKKQIKSFLLAEVYAKSLFEIVLESHVNFYRYTINSYNIQNVINYCLLVVFIIYCLLLNSIYFKKFKLNLINYFAIGIHLFIYIIPRLAAMSLLIFELDIDYLLILSYFNFLAYILINFVELKLIYNSKYYNSDKAQLAH